MKKAKEVVSMRISDKAKNIFKQFARSNNGEGHTTLMAKFIEEKSKHLEEQMLQGDVSDGQHA